QLGVRLLTLVLPLLVLVGTPNAQAAIALRGIATTATTTTTTLTITKPTGVVAGDVMIANISNPGANAGATSTGWILIGAAANTGGRSTVLYKVAGGSEPSSYAFALDAGTTAGLGSIVAFSGVDTSGATPFDVAPGTILTAA